VTLLLLLTGEPPLPPPDLLEPLKLVIADHALSLAVTDGSATGVGHLPTAAAVADRSATTSVGDGRTLVVVT
jgi:hypothetical protein